MKKEAWDISIHSVSEAPPGAQAQERLKAHACVSLQSNSPVLVSNSGGFLKTGHQLSANNILCISIFYNSSSSFINAAKSLEFYVLKKSFRNFLFQPIVNQGGCLGLYNPYNCFRTALLSLFGSYHLKPNKMPVEIITKEDLRSFKRELLSELKELIKENPVEQPQWIKSPQVRKLLSISPGTLQNLRVNGTLPYTKIGGVVYYSMSDIEKVLQSKKVNK